MTHVSSDIPRQLSTVPGSKHFDRAWCDRIDSVFVDDTHIPHCRAYDMDQGWAAGLNGGVWQPRVYGKVVVLLK